MNNENRMYLDEDEEVIWSDYRKIIGITWPFTKYTLTNKKMYIEKGILRYTLNEIQLIRVQDVLLKQSVIERLLGLGSVELVSSDRTTEDTIIGSISEPQKRKHAISETAEKYKIQRGVTSNQFI